VARCVCKGVSKGKVITRNGPFTAHSLENAASKDQSVGKSGADNKKGGPKPDRLFLFDRNPKDQRE
jgi:hypothetical protein